GVAASVLAGIGDDAAILKPRPGRVILATTDLLAERIHFNLTFTSYRQLGYKAAMSNLSDIAAMGGAPRFLLIALALPPRETPRAYPSPPHLTPTARRKQARRLADGRLASAAIDVSDGLAGDIRHICEESGVGCLIDARTLPLSPQLLAHAQARKRDPIAYALSGGEDYELLFTVPPAKVPRVDTLVRLQQLRATAIGVMNPSRQGLLAVGVHRHRGPLTAN